MRTKFELWFPNCSPLRQLAVQIAGMDCRTGRANGFHPPLYNFLANGDTAVTAKLPPFLPTTDSPKAVAAWKYETKTPTCDEQYGFGDRKTMVKGLSLLFDPVVDAFIYSKFLHNHSLSPTKALIVLTDYGPMFDAEVDIEKNPKSKPPVNDWAVRETNKIFNRSGNHGSTIQNLLTCLCGQNDWSHKQISQKDVLLWNFIPFMRGGYVSTGMAGLPNAATLAWVKQCLIWFNKFVDEIKPKQIFWCTSNDVRKLVFPELKRENAGNAGSPREHSKLKLPCGLPVHLLHHPCSWKGKASSPHCKYLNEKL